MTTIINVPPSLDDVTFEQVLEQAATVPPDAKLLLDARHVRWASPFGLTALLTFAQTRAEKVALAVPEADDTASYWARTNFFKHAETVLELHGHVPRSKPAGESSVLLEITRIAQSGDVHEVVSKIGERAGHILTKGLNLEAKATMRFATTLSEVCQNIVEHAESPGWAAVQSYTWKQRLGRKVVVIAVCDSGIGFRRSLEQSHHYKPSDRWDDGAALEEAVIRGISRFREKGRGQGLANTRRFLGTWDGKLSVRSGTARISIVPNWDDDVPLRENLPFMQGSQVQITIPERIAK